MTRTSTTTALTTLCLPSWILLLLVLLLLLHQAPVATARNPAALLDWFQDEISGSYVHAALDIRHRPHGLHTIFERVGPARGAGRPAGGMGAGTGTGTGTGGSSTSTSLGLFANNRIREGEVVLKIPRSFVVTPLPPIVGDHVNARVDVDVVVVDDDDDDKNIHHHEDEAPSFYFVDGVVEEIDSQTGKYTIRGRRLIVNELGDEVGYATEEGGEILVRGVDVSHVAYLEEDVGINCGLVRRLNQEIALGETSVYAPWLKTIGAMLMVDGNKQPGAWSNAGKALLRQVLGAGTGTAQQPYGDEDEYEGVVEEQNDEEILPPIGSTNVLQEVWVDMCHGKPNDPLETIAFFLTLQRNHAGLIVPMLDLFGHRNGKYTNVMHTSIVPEHEQHDHVDASSSSSTSSSISSNSFIQVIAIRDIEPGEELLLSFNFCEPDCEPRHYDWGTPEILRDYGFVEQYPQRWVFHLNNNNHNNEDYLNKNNKIIKDDDYEDQKKLVFDMEEEESQSGGTFKIVWSDHFRLPGEQDLAFFQEQLARLEQLGETKLYSPVHFRDYSSVPVHEWNVIVQYYEALVSALRQLVLTVRRSLDANAFDVFVQRTEKEEQEEEYTNFAEEM